MLTENPVHSSLRALLLFALSGVLVSTSLGLFSGSMPETTVGYLLGYASRQVYADSWAPMITAIERLRADPDVPVYSVVFFEKHIKFQYPLSALLFLDVPQRVTGLSWEDLIKLVNGISWLCVLAIAVVFCFLLDGSALPPGSKLRLSSVSPALLVLVGFAIVGSFYPILRSYYLGQIQTPMILAASLALVAWQRRNFGLAGFLIGVCCAIKPQWIAIILWALLRRQWRLAIVSTITAGVLLLLSMAIYGTRNVLDYLSILSYLSQHGESFYANQSVNGLVNRLLFNGTNLTWHPNLFPPFRPAVYAATIVSSIVVLGVAMFWRMVKSPSSLDLAIMMLSLTIASPIAWDHHYAILLPIFAIAFPTAISQRAFGVWTTMYLWLTFLLTSQKLELITDSLANTNWNFLQSYLFFGAVMGLLLLYRTSWLQESVVAPEETAAG